MICRSRSNRAQAIFEYAIMLACLVAAVLAMQVYIKRSMQGRLRQAADELGQQYAPKETTGTHTYSYSGTTESSTKTLSEAQAAVECAASKDNPVCSSCNKNGGCDFNNNGEVNEEDVYATVSTSTISKDDPTINTETGEEQVGESGASLFE